MKNQRRKIRAEEKVKILRELLENARSISELSEQYGIIPILAIDGKCSSLKKQIEY